MSEQPAVIVYTSKFCPQAWALELMLEKNDVNFELRNIDSNPEHRQTVLEINNGYASVPTLIFPDGATLTEPPHAAVRKKLGIESPNLFRRLFGGFGRSS